MVSADPDLEPPEDIAGQARDDDAVFMIGIPCCRGIGNTS